MVWKREVKQIFSVDIVDCESLVNHLLCNKKHFHLNIMPSAILWRLWNYRNSLVLNRHSWISMKVWSLIVKYLGN